MTRIDALHDWNVTPSQARQLQQTYRDRIRLEPIRKRPAFVAGLDCSLDIRAGRIFAAAVVLSFPALEPVETVTAQRPLTFPYVPGLLSFREAPVCLAAAENVQHPVDLWLIDGQGIAHPRRLGLASHVGLFLDAPAIGCAKSRLTGTYTEPGRDKGCFSDLRDHGETIGAVVRTRTGVRPLFVSPGHRCRLAEAVGYTLACTNRYRLPEPTRLAHQAVTAVKKG